MIRSAMNERCGRVQPASSILSEASAPSTLNCLFLKKFNRPFGLAAGFEIELACDASRRILPDIVGSISSTRKDQVVF